MSKLTPPAPQNKGRRKKFFQENPEYPGAKEALKQMEKEQSVMQRQGFMKKIKRNIAKQQGKKLKTSGAYGKTPDFLIKKKNLEVL